MYILASFFIIRGSIQIWGKTRQIVTGHAFICPDRDSANREAENASGKAAYTGRIATIVKIRNV